VGWIRVKGLRVMTVIGTEPQERLQPQELVVDYALELDMALAGRSDQLQDTIDYMSLNWQIVRLIEASSDLLLERMAKRILDCIMAEPRVEQAWVEVNKPNALPHVETVSVTLQKRKGDER
jgi:D-erythro-7,8-dihydroneopterin triphosphate epimerase